MDENKNKIIVEGTSVETSWDDPDFALVDKMIAYESGFMTVTPESWKQFWQELIDRGICWNSELPEQYPRQAARMLREGWCYLRGPVSNFPSLPEEWKEDDYLMESIKLGFDIWARPPTSQNWGRPLRYNQVQRERIRIFKQNKKIFEKEGNLPEIPKKECCKKK